MWKLLDQLQNKFIKDYNINSLYDELIDLQKIYENNTKIANKTNISKFKRVVEKNYDILDDYGKYKATKYLKNTKISNKEILEFMIYMAYAKEEVKLNEYENNLINTLSEETYTKEVEEIAEKTGKKRHDYKLSYVVAIMLMPNARGYIWNEYKSANVLYNAGETFRYLTTTGTKNLKELLLKQKRRFINKKKDAPTNDKFSGSFDEQAVFIANEIKIQAYKDMGITKALFVSVHDKETTKMCKSLDKQTFYIDKENIYKRYSDNVKSIITFKTMGLKVGKNLPPINDHFHWCRSTITYVLEEE